MKYSEYGFRPLYHNFCIFPLTDKMKEVVGSYDTGRTIRFFNSGF